MARNVFNKKESYNLKVESRCLLDQIELNKDDIDRRKQVFTAVKAKEGDGGGVTLHIDDCEFQKGGESSEKPEQKMTKL
jgi:hypothetical protein